VLSTGLSVVIPTYRNAEGLTPLVQRLEAILQSTNQSYEVLFVDDGSHDDTETMLTALASSRPWLRPIILGRNFGQHNATLCGVRAARYAVCLTLDDDLQTPPEEIPALLRVFHERNVDVMYGTPAENHYGFWRGTATRLIKTSLRIAMRTEVAARISAFRVFRTSLRDAFAHFRGPYVSLDVLLSWGTQRFGYVTVRHEPRAHGQSHYSLWRLASYTFTVLLGFSTFPLRLVAALGISLSAFGIVVLLYVIGRYFIQGGSVPGFPFLASIISIFSGTQLFALGVLGEYITRLYLQSLGQPAYVARDNAASPG
jgi:glycosyltransferase involved in cell wall biosynthesis